MEGFFFLTLLSLLVISDGRPGVPINHSADGLTDALIRLQSGGSNAGGAPPPPPVSNNVASSRADPSSNSDNRGQVPQQTPNQNPNPQSYSGSSGGGGGGIESIIRARMQSACRPIDRGLDVLVILDGSGSVGGNTFDTQIAMLDRIIDTAVFGPDKTRLAVLQYASYTKVEFNFNDFETREQYKEAIGNIRYMSGTTRTGRALQKAFETFSEEHGARIRDNSVAQVVIVVTDGHSQDDPVSSAEALRNAGVIILVVGIGEYVNMAELLEVALDRDHTFVNGTLDQFEAAFNKIAIGELCTYAKGPRGAEIVCNSDHLEVNILTKKPFNGHLYIKNHFDEKNCSIRAPMKKNGQYGNHISLNVKLTSCDIKAQFTYNPRGVLFETTAILMFHEEFNTGKDKLFSVKCFYPDSQYGDQNVTEIRRAFDQNRLYDDALVQETRQMFIENRTISSNIPQMQPPCAYIIRKAEGCILDDVNIGEKLVHTIDCDVDNARQNYIMLVHSCYMTNGKSLQKMMIDSEGCPIDPSITSTVVYRMPYVAQFEIPAVKFPDHSIIKFKCSIKFCNLETMDCDRITSLQCSQGTNGTESTARKKRDSVNNNTLTHFLKQRSNIPTQFLDKINLRQKMAMNGNNESQNHKRHNKKKKRTKLTKKDVLGEGQKATTTPELVTMSKNRRLWKTALKGPVQGVTTENKTDGTTIGHIDFETTYTGHYELFGEGQPLTFEPLLNTNDDNNSSKTVFSISNLDPQFFVMEGLSARIESQLRSFDQIEIESQTIIVNEIEDPDDTRTAEEFCPTGTKSESSIT